MKNTQWMILLVAVAIVATVPLAGATQYEWDGSAEPTSSTPVWTLPLDTGSYTQNGDGTGTISASSSTNDSQNYRMADASYWDHDGSGESVVEYRAKLDSKIAGAFYGACFGVGSDSKYWLMFFDTDGIALWDGGDPATLAKVAVDTSVYHDYKGIISVDGTSLDFYIDSVLRTNNWIGVVSTTGERIDVGDWSGYSGGVSRWDYVRWENNVTPAGAVVVSSTDDPAVEIRWPSVAGAHYQPEYATDLVLSNWVGFGSSVAGNGTTNSVFDSTTSDPQRFYRVVSP